jgi:pSer/pThr/pTyr-binding forkhead associated (FHA) protein
MEAMTKKKPKWFLEGKSRNNTSWIIPVDKSPFIIGRSKTSDLVLSSRIVSRKHAELVIGSDMIYITDLDSTNGSFLNKEKIRKRAFVDPGDLFQFGEFEFKIVYKAESEDSSNDSSYTLTARSPLALESFSDCYGLTKREEEIMHLILEGKSTKELAFDLNISFGTAKNHIYNLFQKIGIHSRIELVARYNNFVN